MILLSTLHTNPAVAAVVIFGGILGSLLATAGAAGSPGQSQQRQRRR